MKKIRNLDMDMDGYDTAFDNYYHLRKAKKELTIDQIVENLGVEKVENALRKLKIKKLTNNK